MATLRPPRLRGLVAALLVLAGGVHLAIAAGRAEGWRTEGIVLAAIGTAQLALAVALLANERRSVLIAVAVSGSVVAAGWVFTRSVGYPLGPYRSLSVPVTPFEVLVVAAGFVAAMVAATEVILTNPHHEHGATAAAPRSAGVLGPTFGDAPSRRSKLDTVAPVVVALVALPGVLAGSWTARAAQGPSSANGGTHSHDMTMAHSSMLTTAERLELGRQITDLLDVIDEFPTLAHARDAGYVPVGRVGAGAGQMMIAPDHRALGSAVDLLHPMALLYAGAEATAPLVGVEFAVRAEGDPPRGFAGADDVWHLHPASCAVARRSTPDAGGGAVEVPLDPPLTGDQCAEAGTVSADPSWMLRAWIVPGWENPAGTFAHDHPALV